jgi:hypothetical protein
MRKFWVTLVFLSMAIIAYAQANNKYKFELKTNLLNLIAVGPSVALEYKLKENKSVMFSLASGHIDYGDFGGITRYKTATFEFRHYFYDNIVFIGPYLKNINKRVFWEQSFISGSIPFTIGQNRDFAGYGLSACASLGIKFVLISKFNVDINSQLGYGRFYKMIDKYANLPSGNYFDTRIGIWFGYVL